MPDSVDSEATRTLLDRLLEDTRLYRTGKDYKELLDFVVRLRNFAPFNAMLLQVQKPGLRFAASAKDWSDRFGRRPNEDARPLMVLWPFGPVALVYDLADTNGTPVPEDAASCFAASGPIDEGMLKGFKALLGRKNIEWGWIDAGDARAGSIRVVKRAANERERTLYRVNINRNHGAPTQFATLAHELAHLFLGHLGLDPKLRVPARSAMKHYEEELEAESVAYLVCNRRGVQCKSQTYLSAFVSAGRTSEQLDIYQVMRAAGQIELLLGLAARTTFDRPARRRDSKSTSAALPQDDARSDGKS